MPKVPKGGIGKILQSKRRQLSLETAVSILLWFQRSWNIPAADALAAVERQGSFFKSVDRFDLDPEELIPKAAPRADDFSRQLADAMQQLLS